MKYPNVNCPWLPATTGGSISAITDSICKNIFAYLFSVHHTISLSRHEQVSLKATMGYSLVFWVGEAPPPKKKNTIFIKMGEGLPAVCREHVQTGRPHTRINNSIFKKLNVISCQWKNRNIQTQFIYANNLCKSFHNLCKYF